MLTTRPAYHLTNSEYVAENETLSAFWWKYLPVALLPCIPILSVIDFDLYVTIFQNERYGLLEVGAVLMLVVAAVLALRVLMDPVVRLDRAATILLVLFTAGCIYFAGEEASWGQHHFGWQTPEQWKAINIQNETNIHNNSVWFNLVPRALLIVAIIVGAFVMPALKLKDSPLLIRRFDLLFPPLGLRWIAGVIIAIEIYTQFENNFDLDDYILFSDGETQEFYLAWALLLQSFVIHRRWVGWKAES